jgi:putative transposase
MNKKWSMDLVAQRSPIGCRIRILTVVDQVTRECFALHADSARGREKGTVLTSSGEIWQHGSLLPR